VHAFKAIGALPAKVTIPDYRKMEAAGDGMKMLRECIEGTGVAERVWSVGTRCAASDDDRPRSSAALPSRTVCEDVMMPMPMVGDVFLFRNGQSGCHCGMCVKPFPPHFVHLSRNGFLEEPMNQKHWTDALAFVYRLVEESDQRSAVSGQPEADSREPNADSRAPEVRA
jgi:hypothetical protein